MKSTALFLSILFLFASCQSPKLQFDRLQFYYGNSSLPPPFQEHYRVKLDSTEGLVSQTKGQDETSSGFSISQKDWAKLMRYAQKLSPMDKDLGEKQVGAAMTSLVLKQGDSTVYSLIWQEHQKVSKAHKKIEAKLRDLAPAIGVNLVPQESYQEGGE
jgi:hypothetical protein